MGDIAKLRDNDFTQGSILPKLLKFMFPVLLAMLLQATYGAVDLIVVGQFATKVELAGVATGSQIIFTLTEFIVNFGMGVTVAIGKYIGEKDYEKSARAVGTGIIIFIVIGLVLSLCSIVAAVPLAKVMQAPKESISETVEYIRICGIGFIVITAYNILGSIFRGLGDSKTPLIAVGIACVFNVIGDLIFVAVFKWGAKGAALATVISQFISVVISFFIIKKTPMPFKLKKKHLKCYGEQVKDILVIGTPIALQDFLVSASFLVLMAIVNKLGVDASAGVGVAEKVCNFIMLVPLAFMQSMSAFVAQNVGAKKPERADKSLKTGILVSFCFGVVMFVLTFFFGDGFARIFSNDKGAVTSAFNYLKGYGIDCLFTCFLFCFIGYYNGLGKTTFVMIQGTVGSLLVRVPVAFLMREIGGGSMFLIALAIPISTVIQIIMSFIEYKVVKRKINIEKTENLTELRA